MICVGIDVAKDKHDCFILSSEGEVLADIFTIANNAEGFNTLLQTIRRCTRPADKIKVGLEATGHYSYNILGFLLDCGLATYVINPLHTNLYRKSLSLRKTKTDRIDARTIATMLMSDVDLKRKGESTMNKIVYLNDKEAQVSKAFEKKACIFGTDEFYRWQEYKAMFPNAKMVVKKINRNPNQKTRRNLTYANMEEYIRTFPEENAKKLVKEFGVIKARSHVQKSPYQYVLNWFLATFQNYDNFQPFMDEKEQERVKTEQEAAQDTAVPQLKKTA